MWYDFSGENQAAKNQTYQKLKKKAKPEEKEMAVKDEIHGQIVAGLKDAKFPINTPGELLAAFPAGADTTCKAGDIEVTAGEAGKLLTEADFPFKDAKQVADTIVGRAGL